MRAHRATAEASGATRISTGSIRMRHQPTPKAAEEDDDSAPAEPRHGDSTLRRGDPTIRLETTSGITVIRIALTKTVPTARR